MTRPGLLLRSLLLGLLALSMLGGALPALAQGAVDAVAKDRWAREMIQSKAIAEKACEAGSFLLTCFTPATKSQNPADNGKTLGQADCLGAVDGLTRIHLADGSDPKSPGKVGMFYNRLPAVLNLHLRQSYANKLAVEITGQVMGLLGQIGSTMIQTDACKQKLMMSTRIGVK